MSNGDYWARVAATPDQLASVSTTLDRLISNEEIEQTAVVCLTEDDLRAALPLDCRFTDPRSPYQPSSERPASKDILTLLKARKRALAPTKKLPSLPDGPTESELTALFDHLPQEPVIVSTQQLQAAAQEAMDLSPQQVEAAVEGKIALPTRSGRKSSVYLLAVLHALMDRLRELSFESRTAYYALYPQCQAVAKLLRIQRETRKAVVHALPLFETAYQQTIQVDLARCASW